METGKSSGELISGGGLQPEHSDTFKVTLSQSHGYIIQVTVTYQEYQAQGQSGESVLHF